jgi:uncharacterized protein with FMN-binding domain
MQTYEQNGRKKLVGIVVATVILGGAVIAADKLKTKSVTAANTEIPTTPTDTPAATDTPTATSNATATPSSSGYKDGSYSATATYRVPHGSESIGVTLTVKNGTVTGSSLQQSMSDRESQRYQEDFAAEYQAYVVGQKLSSLNVPVVAGASDTSDAFNQAANQITQKAQG